MTDTGCRNAAGRSRSGSALLLVTVIVVVLMGITGAYLAILGTELSQAANAVNREAAFTAAESGIDAAVNELNAQIDYGADGLGAGTGSFGRVSYAVTIEPAYAGPMRYVLRSRGESGDLERGVVAVVGPEGATAGRFANAVFGEFAVELKQNASIDSYDSREGDYTEKRVNRLRNQLYAKAKGNVKSNGAVKMDANSKVFGDATSGKNESAVLQFNAYVDGSLGRANERENLSPVEVPDLPSIGSDNVPKGRMKVLAAGAHRFDTLVLEAGATLRIDGPATIVLGHFEAGAGAKIEVHGKAGPVTIVGTGKFQVHPTARWDSATKRPTDLSLKIASDNLLSPLSTVEIDGTGPFYGTVYAPNADLNLDSGMEVFGAVTARSVVLGRGVEVHYDEALAPDSSSTVFRVLSWEEAPPKKKGKNPKP